MSTVDANSPLRFDQNIGWSSENLTGLEGAAMSRSYFKVNAGELRRLTNEAARGVFEKKGYSPETVEILLKERDVYDYTLLSYGGVPYLIAQFTAKIAFITAGLWKEQLTGEEFKKEYHLYFELPKGTKVKGSVRRLEQYEPMSDQDPNRQHPMRLKYAIGAIEEQYYQLKARMPQVDLIFSNGYIDDVLREKVNISMEALLRFIELSVNLEKTYTEILEPFLLEEIKG